ncbi:LytR/AlgR family response regulator transcription factor [Lewinella sp. IMCC34183]|uniref:LytR/AlgR family response regulator transcription factor n=1 Tax=Lewinella sp. IMCC34183 TaxID=2248762 RepID=UPI000E2702F6|nr:response regulator [Lewinella sp. IMCC34183]
MDAISILVVEDDPIIAADIESSVNRMGYAVTEKIAAGKEVLPAVRRSRPDLVLMDVQLGDDIDGIEVAHRLNQEFPTPVIFLTANSDRVTFERAREAVPAAFVSKPFDVVDLQRGIDLAIRNFSRQDQPEASDGDSVILQDRIFIRDTRRNLFKVEFADILYIQAQGNYCDIFTVEGKHTVTCNLKYLLTRLDNYTFVRVHRSYLINLAQLDSVGEVYLHLKGRQVPLSHGYRIDFLSRLNTL